MEKKKERYRYIPRNTFCFVEGEKGRGLKSLFFSFHFLFTPFLFLFPAKKWGKLIFDSEWGGEGCSLFICGGKWRFGRHFWGFFLPLSVRFWVGSTFIRSSSPQSCENVEKRRVGLVWSVDPKALLSLSSSFCGGEK